MDEDLAAYAEIGEGDEGTLRPIEAHMPHALAGFLAQPGADHLVIRPEGAIEEHEGRTGKASRQLRRHRRAAGDVEEGLLAAFFADAQADRVPGPGSGGIIL